MEQKNKQTGKVFLYELKDLFAGAAFPLMLSLIISVTFIGMTTSLYDENDKILPLVLLIIGEIAYIVTLVIFGRQSGITSVRKILQHAKKREITSKDFEANNGIGEYSAYKGFVIGFLSCIPFIIFQIIQCAAPNKFCPFVLEFVFGWAALPFSYIDGASDWLNLIMVLLPTVVHGVTYIVCAHMEWNKQQKLAEMRGEELPEKEDDNQPE